MLDFPTSVGPSPSLILRPGLLTLPKGTERYVVEGGGSVIVEVQQGDRVEVINTEGCQPCEMIGVGKDGKFNDSILSERANSEAEGFKNILASGDESAKRANLSLQRRGIEAGKARALRVFSQTSPAGDTTELRIENEGVLIVAAPAAPMDFDLQDTATPLELFIHRATIQTAEQTRLPEPLADPVQDFRIPMASARSFTVKAGEYIQIIDVEGRQCSDFQAFDRRKLDAGNEQALDATVTRSLIGLANPIPGLPAKAFDLEMDPLVEMIQDTCGRHDVFMTACNSKYYDEMGYPGHVNCTDNFNGALTDHGVAKRRGWEALNYFYNTNVDDANQI